MSNKLVSNPMLQIIDSNGPVNRAQIFTYLTGTTTPHPTYEGPNGAQNPNPIETNNNGYPDAGGGAQGIYLDPTVKYTIVVKTAAGSTIWSLDEVSSLDQLIAIASSKTATYNITIDDNNSIIPVNAFGGAITITLDPCADLPPGFNVTIKKTDSSNFQVTIDPDGAETIDGSGTAILSAQNDAMTLVNTGTQWLVISKASSSTTVTAVYDNGGNLVLQSDATVNAVNYWIAKNAAAGGTISLKATGTDTNIPAIIAGKGTGAVQIGQATSVGVDLLADQPIRDSSSNEFIKFSKTASAVNEITVANAATTFSPVISATGGDTNIDLSLLAAGTGAINIRATSSNSAKLRLFEDSDNGSNYVEIAPVAAITSNRTITLPDADVDLTGATAAVMETATATNTYVSPGVQQRHPGHPKAWLTCDSSGGVTVSYNITGVADTGTGIVTITIATDFSTSYACVGSAGYAAAGATCNTVVFEDFLPSSVELHGFNASGVHADATVYCMAAFGDQ